jgi:hypothetical protein
MDYELAKELKEAGFPQSYKGAGLGGKYICPHEDGVHPLISFGPPVGSSDDLCEEGSYLPTLSELLAACGPQFWSLGRTPKGQWFACGTTEETGDEEREESTAHCVSAKEAVARLWLALYANADGPAA